MKAVVLSQFGDEEALEYRDWADPLPGPGDVMIRVDACGVNHVDLDVRAGVSRFPIELPRVLGREIAGEVVDVGADVHDLAVGDAVAAGEMFTSCWKCEMCLSGRDNLCWSVDYPGVFRDGGYAQYCVLPAEYCAKSPDGLTAEVSAAGQVTFGTAWHALTRRSLGANPAETVLVTAAGSGVGTAAIQVAGLLGLRVIAAVGNAAKADSLRSIGADEVVVYGQDADGLASSVMELTSGQGVDLVLEIAGGPIFRQAMASLRAGGRLVLAGAHAGETVLTDLVEIFRYERSVLGTARATRGEMSAVLTLLASGRLRPLVDRLVPLERAADAHRRLARRENVGKVVLLPWGIDG